MKIFDGVIADITISNIAYVASKVDTDIRAYLSAIEIDNKDIEDDIQYFLAKDSGCELIVTNDKSFYRGDIKVVAPQELASLYH